MKRTTHWYAHLVWRIRSVRPMISSFERKNKSVKWIEFYLFFPAWLVFTIVNKYRGIHFYFSTFHSKHFAFSASIGLITLLVQNNLTFITVVIAINFWERSGVPFELHPLISLQKIVFSFSTRFRENAGIHYDISSIEDIDSYNVRAFTIFLYQTENFGAFVVIELYKKLRRND